MAETAPGAPGDESSPRLSPPLSALIDARQQDQRPLNGSTRGDGEMGREENGGGRGGAQVEEFRALLSVSQLREMTL